MNPLNHFGIQTRMIRKDTKSYNWTNSDNLLPSDDPDFVKEINDNKKWVARKDNRKLRSNTPPTNIPAWLR
jgi:hypothetical protein